MYLISLGAGILAGVLYGAPLTSAWFASECKPRITGLTPSVKDSAADESCHA